MVKYRSFKDKSDYIKIREFLEDGISVSGPLFYYGLGDFDFGVMQRSSDDYLENINEIFKDSLLWFDDNGDLMGGLFPSRNIMDMFIHPNKKNLFPNMVEEGENFIKYSSSGKYNEIEWWVFEGDKELENVLAARAYHKTERYRPHYVFDYSKHINQEPLPQGYAIRNFSEIADKSVIIELYKKYFNIEIRESMLNNFIKTSTYRPELDIAVTAPDGSVASFCTIRYDAKNRIGTFEPVACHPDHKQKHITKILMQEGLKRVRKLGAEKVTVQTSYPQRNLPANKLYQSVGFEEIGKLYFWIKVIE